MACGAVRFRSLRRQRRAAAELARDPDHPVDRREGFLRRRAVGRARRLFEPVDLHGDECVGCLRAAAGDERANGLQHPALARSPPRAPRSRPSTGRRSRGPQPAARARPSLAAPRRARRANGRGGQPVDWGRRGRAQGRLCFCYREYRTPLVSCFARDCRFARARAAPLRRSNAPSKRRLKRDSAPTAVAGGNGPVRRNTGRPSHDGLSTAPYNARRSSGARLLLQHLNAGSGGAQVFVDWGSSRFRSVISR